MRLHWADEEKLVEMPLDIKMALVEWEEINQDPRKWARFEAAQFKYERHVRVEWGTIHSNGMKEAAIQTITYHLMKDGSVDVNRTTHP